MPRPKKKGAEITPLRLTQDIRWLAKQLGGDNRTAGVEMLGEMTRLLSLAHGKLDGLDSEAQAIADEIKALGIPLIYEQAKAEPVVVEGPDGKPAAWIF